MDSCTGGVGDLNLSHDEVVRIKEAFKDPEFQKLFREYANEISNPENRKRYEEEIRLLEMERGIDVEFINPIPGHCLKSHHWPKVYAADATPDHSDGESVKVFINVCKSDKVECPIIKSAVDSNGEKVSGGCFWRLPHCLSPPREDFDKKKRRVMIYDVAFHSKAFDLAFTRSTLRRLLDYTAVDGVRRQFNLCLGKTAQQAVYLAQLLGPTEHPTESSNAFASPVCVPQSPMHEEALLKAVRTLKGTAYKGIARPTVIRRRRPDYASRQAELDRRISEDMQNCSDASQREALKMLATYPCVSSERAPNRTTKDLASPTEPRYTVTHCSEFDMINSRDAPDVNPLRPPDSLKIAIKLPGLSSSACLDLDVTSTHLMLTSEKPVAYKLNLKLPFEVNETKGTAKFDKSSSLLTVVIPVMKREIADGFRAPTSFEQSFSGTDCKLDTSLVCTTEESSPSPSTSACTSESTKSHRHIKKSRRKRNRRRRPSVSNASSSHETLDTVPPHAPSIQANELGSEDKDGHITIDSSKSSTVTSPIGTSCRCEQFSPPASSVVFNMDISVTRIDIQELRVSKDRRLAPVRFRQDPFSLSVLLPVRGILPTTLSLHWATESSDKQEPHHLGANSLDDCSSCSLDHLSLLLQFSSRGPGGFTMDWGLVLRCPLSDKSSLSYQECDGPVSYAKESARNQERFCNHNPPKLIQSSFSHANAVLLFAKSLVSDPTVPHMSTCQITSHNESIWWKSIAVGRTLSAGMQEYPFVGLDGCLTGCIDTLDVALCDSQNNLAKRIPGYLQVTALSPDECDITWFRSDKLSPHAISSARKCLPDAIDLLASAPAKGHVNTQFDTTVALKGILKTRSYSESSVDEQTNGFVNFRDAGLADTGTEHVFSDDFPSADSVAEGEHVHPSADGFYDSSTWKSVNTHFVGCQSFRRCYSNEKLAFSGATASNERAYCERSLNVQRQRRHSVNFSSHDQQMAYSPRDTVERLHQALLHRRKKSRLRESRRRSVVFTGSHSGVCVSNAFNEGVRCGLQHVSNVTPVLDNSADPLVTSNGFGEETRSFVDFRDRITPEPCEQNKMNDQLVCGPTDHSLPTEPLLVSDTLMNSTASNPKSTVLLTEHNVTTSGFSAHPDQCTVNLSTSHILELDGE